MNKQPVNLSIKLNDTDPVYRQIADALRRLLVEHKLEPGEMLPPVRELALDLALNFNTVAQAYRILAQEGWLDLRRHRGAQVLNRATPLAGNVEEESFLRRLHELIAQAKAGGISAKRIKRELQTIIKGLEP
jgi:GntR family transcriptional regulator